MSENEVSRHLEFVKKRKLEKEKLWKQELDPGVKGQLIKVWKTANEPTRLGFLQQVFSNDKELSPSTATSEEGSGHYLWKQFKEDDEDFARFEILMKQLSDVYARQKSISYTELLELLVPHWTHPELKQKGFHISSHTFAEARRRAGNNALLGLGDPPLAYFESDSDSEELPPDEGYQADAFPCSVAGLDPQNFHLPPQKKKLLYLEPATRSIPEGTAFHHF